MKVIGVMDHEVVHGEFPLVHRKTNQNAREVLAEIVTMVAQGPDSESVKRNSA
jgi:hypothetical protein